MLPFCALVWQWSALPEALHTFLSRRHACFPSTQKSLEWGKFNLAVLAVFSLVFRARLMLPITWNIWGCLHSHELVFSGISWKDRFLVLTSHHATYCLCVLSFLFLYFSSPPGLGCCVRVVWITNAAGRSCLYNTITRFVGHQLNEQYEQVHCLTCCHFVL